MRELENYGVYLLKELGIDRKPDWGYLINKYRVRKERGRHYGRPHINYTVASVCELDSGDLLLKTKKHKISNPRSIAQYMMRLCGWEDQEIAEYYGCTHST